MSKRFSKSIQWGIIGIWLCLVFILVYRHYISGAPLSSLQSLSGKQFTTSEEWFGIYVKDLKIGYLKTLSEKIGDEYRFTQQGETNIPQEGGNIRTTTEFKCLTDLNYRIKSFDFENRSAESFFKSHGELDEENMLLVFMENGGQKKTEARKLEGQPYLPSTVKQALYARGLEKGMRFSIPVLNIFSLNTEDTNVEVRELIPVKVGINVNTAYLLKIGDTLSWISDRGSTLKEKNAAGLLYLAETEDSAKSEGPRYIFDFLSIPAIKSNELLPYPEKLTYLRLRLTGLNLSDFPLLNEGRQVFREGVIEISRENEDALKAQTYDLPYKGEDLGPFLEPTPFVQSDHHTIIYNANKFVDIEKNAFRLARYLTSNLYLTIRKMPRFRLSTSMEIFKNRVGESNEHTVMFTAFARAGGLPVRMVSGLVYLKGHFYYQAWPEVWIGQWVPADPAMGQFPADVTHIRLMEGDIDAIASLGGIIKNIKVEIMEAQ